MFLNSVTLRALRLVKPSLLGFNTDSLVNSIKFLSQLTNYQLSFLRESVRHKNITFLFIFDLKKLLRRKLLPNFNIDAALINCSNFGNAIENLVLKYSATWNYNKNGLHYRCLFTHFTRSRSPLRGTVEHMECCTNSKRLQIFYEKILFNYPACQWH